MRQLSNANTLAVKNSTPTRPVPVRLRYRGVSLISSNTDLENGAVTNSTGDTSHNITMSTSTHSDILANSHTVSTEAKSLHRKSLRYSDLNEQVVVPKVSTRYSHHKYSLNDIRKITERMMTPPSKSTCTRLNHSVNQLTMIDRFGVPPHLWGRQKPADKHLIERLVKPTTSYSQRRALTLQQYKPRDC